jgi:hypothetical protein
MLRAGTPIVGRTASTLSVSTESGERTLKRVLGQVIFESLNVTVNDCYEYQCEGNGKVPEGMRPFGNLLDSDEQELTFLPAEATNSRTIIVAARPDNFLHVFDHSRILGPISSVSLRFYVRDITVASTCAFKYSGDEGVPRYKFSAKIGMTADQFDRLFRYFWLSPFGATIRVVLGVQSFDAGYHFDGEPDDFFLELDKTTTADLRSISTVRQFKSRPLFEPGT